MVKALQSTSNIASSENNIVVGRKYFEKTDRFVYLVSVISDNKHIDLEIKRCLIFSGNRFFQQRKFKNISSYGTIILS